MLRYVLLISLMMMPLVATAAEIEFHPATDELPDLITVEGELQADDQKRFQQLAIPLDEAIVVFNSAGGHLLAGIEIGRTIQIKDFATFVFDGHVCASACALAWLGGTLRFASDGSYIGFHAAYVESLTGELVTSAPGNALAGSYLNSIGMNDRAVAEFTAANPDDMHQLTPERAIALGIQVNWIPAEGQPESGTTTTEAPEQDTVAGPQWVGLPDVDLPGGDLPGMPLIEQSWMSCQHACQRNSACIAFTYNQEYRACFLKGYFGEGLPFSGAYSGYRADLAAAPDILARQTTSITPFRTSRGFEIIARPFFRFQDVTHEWCHTECLNSRMCQGYSYYQNGDCSFMTDAGELRKATGVVSGRKILR